MEDTLSLSKTWDDYYSTLPKIYIGLLVFGVV